MIQGEMMMTKYLLAHDLGTSGDKATLFTTDGAIVDSRVAGYGVEYSHGSWAEQDPEDWWRAVAQSTRDLLADIDPARVAGVSFSGHMNGCVLVDRAGRPLRKAIIWADVRADYQADTLLEKIPMKRFYDITGQRANASNSIEKLMWVRDNQPEIYENTYKMLQSKDYISLKLTGNFVTDYTDASNSNAWDIRRNAWSEEVLAASGIDGDKLPQPVESTAVVGYVTAQAAALTGLKEGTPVVAGGGDGVCATVGAGCIRQGEAYCCIGSSAWVSMATEQPVFDPEMRTFTLKHIVPGLYSPNGAMQSAGTSYNWMRDQICLLEHVDAAGRDAVYNRINEQIQRAPAGSNGLLFLPYLIGERSPWWDPQAKGAWIGLKLEHRREELLRSVAEGVAMNLAVIYGAFADQVEIQSFRLIGGAAKARMWQQMLADVTGREIVIPNHLEEATSMGAAITAGVGVGVFPDFTVVDRFVQSSTVVRPHLENTEKYRELLLIFQDSYRALESIYERLSDLERR